jgi:hypothetical protein
LKVFDTSILVPAMTSTIAPERKRSTSLPNLLGLLDQSSGTSGPAFRHQREADSGDEGVLVPYDALLEASRSMERLQQELENRESVIRELAELRAKDKAEFEQQLCHMRGQILQERSKSRILVQRYGLEMQQQRPGGPGAVATGKRVVTGGVTVLNEAVWNNKAVGDGQAGMDVQDGPLPTGGGIGECA